MSPETIKQTSTGANQANIDPGLQQGQDPAVLLVEQAERFSAAVPAETISDQHDFQRVRFSVGNDSYVFRGREELPVLSERAESVKKEVLTTDESPVYTDKNEYKVWVKDQEESPGEEAEGENIEYIASDTPRGIVDVAIKLIEKGHGDKAQKDRLNGLRRKLVDDDIDEEALGLFDIIYVAGAVDLETGNVVDNRNASPEAPMLAALAISGDELSQEIINTKRQLVDAEDEKRLFSRDGFPLKRPGEPLNDAEIELMKDAHFIAVHTTPTAPKTVNEQGERGIFPTGQYELEQQLHYPRETIHWSLNHAVDSHMMGDFKGREITIVDSLDELAKINGAPNSLYGVDTYFSANPGEPLLLSANASIVQVKESTPEQPIITRSGNDIHINNRGIKAEDFDTLASFFRYDEKYGATDSDGKLLLAQDLSEKGSLRLDWQMVERIKNGEQDSAYEFLSDEQKAKSEEYMKPFKSAYELVKDDLPENPSESDYRRAIEHLFEKIVTGEVNIAEHPEFHAEIIETTRIMAVNELIEEKGGRVEKAGGQSQYMAREGFKEEERRIVSTIGLNSGLHDNNKEGWTEEVFKRTRSQATSGSYEEGTLKFDWSKYDDSSLWQTMAGNSWQNRRHLVRSGMLSFTPKKTQKTGGSFLSAPATAF
ncbi:MAG TPA: hypothetical protein VFK11_05175 [Candidatus Saccharimonadales bacterium]|nr:hypothetical protein [Candidatus Saccharimonadales bacterium]